MFRQDTIFLCNLLDGYIANRKFFYSGLFLSTFHFFGKSVGLHTFLDNTIKLLPVDDRISPLLVRVNTIVLYLVRNLILAEFVFLHDISRCVIVGVNRFPFAF